MYGADMYAEAMRCEGATLHVRETQPWWAPASHIKPKSTCAQQYIGGLWLPPLAPMPPVVHRVSVPAAREHDAYGREDVRVSDESEDVDSWYDDEPFIDLRECERQWRLKQEERAQKTECVVRENAKEVTREERTLSIESVKSATKPSEGAHTQSEGMCVNRGDSGRTRDEEDDYWYDEQFLFNLCENEWQLKEESARKIESVPREQAIEVTCEDRALSEKDNASAPAKRAHVRSDMRVSRGRSIVVSAEDASKISEKRASDNVSDRCGKRVSDASKASNTSKLIPTYAAVVHRHAGSPGNGPSTPVQNTVDTDKWIEVRYKRKKRDSACLREKRDVCKGREPRREKCKWRARFEGACHVCKVAGHRAFECPTIVCFGCRRRGHRVRACPSRVHSERKCTEATAQQRVRHAYSRTSPADTREQHATVSSARRVEASVTKGASSEMKLVSEHNACERDRDSIISSSSDAQSSSVAGKEMKRARRVRRSKKRANKDRASSESDKEKDVIASTKFDEEDVKNVEVTSDSPASTATDVQGKPSDADVIAKLKEYLKHAFKEWFHEIFFKSKKLRAKVVNKARIKSAVRSWTRVVRSMR